MLADCVHVMSAGVTGAIQVVVLDGFALASIFSTVLALVAGWNCCPARHLGLLIWFSFNLISHDLCASLVCACGSVSTKLFRLPVAAICCCLVLQRFCFVSRCLQRFCFVSRCLQRFCFVSRCLQRFCFVSRYLQYFCLIMCVI